MYASKTAINQLFRLRNDKEAHLDAQIDAISLLAAHGLDVDSLKSLKSRWAMKWTKTWGDGEGARTRVIYQWQVFSSASPLRDEGTDSTLQCLRL